MKRDVTFGDENDVHFPFDTEENQLCVGKEEKDECWYAPIGNKDEHLCGENDNFEKLKPGLPRKLPKEMPFPAGRHEEEPQLGS